MMTLGVVGRKVGMTRIFSEMGVSEPVTVIHVVPNRVSQIKTESVDGYNAIQLTGGVKKANRVNKPMAGHFAKASVEAGDMMVEFRVSSVEEFKPGQLIDLGTVFQSGQYVDVSSQSKGKGFAGTVKRHNFRTQDATHGNSRSHRVLGSIGQNQTPGRVFKGKKMPGQYGNKRVTIQSLEVLRVDAEKNLILVKGGVPGCPGAMVEVRPAVKRKSKG